MTVLLVAAPLMARSGVYRSALDLVDAARQAGLAWHAVLGVRPDAPGTPSTDPRVQEVAMPEHGRRLLGAIGRLLDSATVLHAATTVISLIPQSDMVVARRTDLSGAHRVAWVRGLPWPGASEQGTARRVLLTALERRALRGFDDVWSTTPLLEAQLGRSGRGRIVPAGVPLLQRPTRAARPSGAPAVFAGRLSPEKGADRFLAMAARTGVAARIHGSGALEAELRRASSPNVVWGGWQTPAAIWADAGVCVVPSARDAFGRTPVEAASAGVPVVMSDQVGVAPLLYTDEVLRRRFVLPLERPDLWDRAVIDLTSDAGLATEVADHVWRNARSLTIESSLTAAVAALSASDTRC